jgi:hypothetical protein
MAQSIYTAVAAADVALSAATAKSVIGVQGGSDFAVDLKKIHFGFDGVTAANTPVLVELCAATFVTNPPGTNSTAITITNASGRANAATGFLAAYSWSAEPTVLTTISAHRITPNSGTELYDFGNWGDTPDSPLNQGFVIRLTAAQTVNVRPTLWFART